MAKVIATSVSIATGVVHSGALDDAATQNGVYYAISETTGTPGTDVRFTFTVAGTATSVAIYGRYEGNAGHNVNIEAWNGTGWDILGTWPHAVSDALLSWNLDAGHTIGGSVLVRADHTSPGNVNHDFWFDYMYVVAPSPDNMQLDDGTNTILFSPLVDPAYVRPDSRVRGNFQARSGKRQYWQTGGAHRSDVSLNDISKACADQLNDWWRGLTILTFTPNLDDAGTTLFARISPGGQAPLQIWFDTGFQNKYTGTITIVEVSSSSSST